MKNFFKLSVCCLFLGGSLLTLVPAFAATPVPSDPNQAPSASDEVYKQLQAAAGSQGANYGTAVDPRLAAARIIRLVLTFLGIIFIALTIYAGFLWMTAAGEKEKIEKAQGIIKASAIGLLIILAAYSITLFAFRVGLQQYQTVPSVEFRIDTYPQSP